LVLPFRSDWIEIFDFSRLIFDLLISLHELLRRILCQCKQNQSMTQIKLIMTLLWCWNWLKFNLNIPIQLTQFRHQTYYFHTGLMYTYVRTKSRVETIFIEDDAGSLLLKQFLRKTVYFGFRIRRLILSFEEKWMQGCFNKVCLNPKQYWNKFDLLSRWTQLQHTIAVFQCYKLIKSHLSAFFSCSDIQQ